MSHETCPFFPGKAFKAHWGLDWPDKATGRKEEIRQVFQDAFDLIKKRIEAFLCIDIERMDNIQIADELKRIGEIM